MDQIEPQFMLLPSPIILQSLGLTEARSLSSLISITRRTIDAVHYWLEIGFSLLISSPQSQSLQSASNALVYNKEVLCPAQDEKIINAITHCSLFRSFLRF